MFASVTYLDTDRRAPGFFGDADGILGVITSRSGGYRVDTRDLDSYLVPEKPQNVTAELLHRSGRGIGYTKSPFAYPFTRVA